MNTQVIKFLKANPNSNKGQIADAINLRGLGLFNLLKRMVNDGEIVVEGEGHDATYSLVLSEERSETEVLNETAGEETEQVTAGPTQTETKAAKKQVGRNSGTYKFNGVSYNKGKLINAVVAAYCATHKNITHDKLKEVFPDTLMKRFGIFQTVEKAREISGSKYDRYFFKEEFQIKLKDCVICTCNQITSDNILPFIEICVNKLGIVIEAE